MTALLPQIASPADLHKLTDAQLLNSPRRCATSWCAS